MLLALLIAAAPLVPQLRVDVPPSSELTKKPPSAIPAYAFFGLSSICTSTAVANLIWFASLVGDGASATTGFTRSLLVSAAGAAGVASAFATLGLVVLIQHLSRGDPG